MIDLEDALAPLVDGAPEPPAVDRVVRRGRVRRRRRAGALATTLVLVAGIAIGAIATIAHHSTPRLAGVTDDLDHVRVTLLDGSQLEISGPPSLGLTKLEPEFNAELDWVGKGRHFGAISHSFTVQRTTPDYTGASLGTYPTGDGHELVVHATATGEDAVVEYPGWFLVVHWNHDPTDWGYWANGLNAAVTADGFLHVGTTDPGWKLGPTDAPDLALGGGEVGSGAAFGFFGPVTHPEGCPTPEQATGRTPQGWPVVFEAGASWCDPTQHVRLSVWDEALVHDAVDGLRVSYTDASHVVDRITTLDGTRYEVTASSSIFDQLVLQTTLSIPGVDQPNLLNENQNPLPVTVTRSALPEGAGAPSFASADGNRFASYHLPTECNCDVLAATYGEWLVEIEVQRSGAGAALSDADRAKVASEFAAHETADGFLVIERPAPAEGPFADIVLNGVDMYTSASGCAPPNPVEARTPQGFGVHVVGSGAHWCDPQADVSIDTLGPPWQPIVAVFRVRRL